jgi:hypothetical protein
VQGRGSAFGLTSTGWCRHAQCAADERSETTSLMRDRWKAYDYGETSPCHICDGGGDEYAGGRRLVRASAGRR